MPEPIRCESCRARSLMKPRPKMKSESEPASPTNPCPIVYCVCGEKFSWSVATATCILPLPKEHIGYIVTHDHVENWPDPQVKKSSHVPEAVEIESSIVAIMATSEIWKCSKCGSIGIVEFPATDAARYGIQWYYPKSYSDDVVVINGQKFTVETQLVLHKVKAE